MAGPLLTCPSPAPDSQVSTYVSTDADVAGYVNRLPCTLLRRNPWIFPGTVNHTTFDHTRD